MSSVHIVQVGVQGHVGRFDSVDGCRHGRDALVVCRTERGLEVGRVLASDAEISQQPASGQLLRRMTPDDQLLYERIQRYRDRAFLACERLLQQRHIKAVLVDVEHLFDGQSIYFYFLGQPGPELDLLTADLAAAYEKKVRFRKFAETLVNGCGPDCGTGISQCGSGNCERCGIKSGRACASPR